MADDAAAMLLRIEQELVQMLDDNKSTDPDAWVPRPNGRH
jgi:hypothetical protein